MSKTVKAVMFRVNATEPEWIDLDPERIHDVLGCEMLEYFDVSSRLTLWADADGRIALKSRNRCIAQFASCDADTEFYGDVLFVASVSPTEDEETDVGDEFHDVTDEELSALKAFVGEYLKQRDTSYRDMPPFVMNRTTP